MLDFLGVTENWSAIENIPWTQRWTFSDDSTGDPISLDGVSFGGKVYIGRQYRPIDLDIQKSAAEAEPNVLVVSCVGLPEGRHAYEIFSVSESGNQNRMISGYIGVIKSIDKLADQAKSYASRTLSVRLPGDVTRQIRLEWLSSTLAATAAQQAWEYYEQTKKTAEAMADTAKKAQEAVDKLANLDATLAALDKDIKKAQQAAADAQKWAEDAGRAPYIGTNGNWWILSEERAKDLGVRAEGRDGKNGEHGKTPIIQYFKGDKDGIHYDGLYWYVWGINPQTAAEEYIFTATLAEGKNGTPGKDGLDADAIKRLYLEFEADLPHPGDHGTVCYVKNEQNTYTVYCWLLKPDGTSDWLPVNQDLHDYSQYAHADLGNITVAADNYETQYPEGFFPKLSWVKRAIASAITNATTQFIRIATTRVLGMVKLSEPNQIDATLAAPVGLNPDNQIVVPRARWDQYGAVKLSWVEPIPDIHFPAPVGLNANGQLAVTEATIDHPGVIKINNTKDVVDGTPVQTSPDNLAVVPHAGFIRHGTVCFGTEFSITINNAPHIVTIPKCNGDATYNQHAGNVKNSMIFNLAQHGALKYDGAGQNGTNTGNSLYISHDETLNITSEGKLSAKIWVEQTLGNYVTTSALEAKQYVTKTQHDADIATRVECAGGIKKLSYMSEEQYANLATKDASTLYLLY